MVLTTLPKAGPRRVPATPRKEAATAALRVARTLAMTWAALRLSPRLPLINRPPLPCESPARRRGTHGRGGSDVLPDPTELMRDTPGSKSARSTSPQIAGLPLPGRGIHGPSAGPSYSARSRFPGRPGPARPPVHDQHALPGHDRSATGDGGCLRPGSLAPRTIW